MKQETLSREAEKPPPLGVGRDVTAKEDTLMGEITQTSHLTSAALVPEQASNLEDSMPQIPVNEEALDEELLEEELIIEDFTIDGICGVY